MARKRGPIGRVRNIRNTDISSIPLPYPQMIVTMLPYSDASTVVVLTPVNPNTGDGYDMSVFPSPTPDQFQGCWLKGAPGAGFLPTGVSIVGNFIVLDYAPEPASSLDQFVITPWGNTWRGLNGEWLAPWAGLLQ